MTYQATILADSPVGYWRLGETSGTNAVDASTGSHNGTYHLCTLNQTGAVPGGDKAINIGTVGAYVDLGAFPTGFQSPANSFSLECWVRFTGSPTGGASFVRWLDGGAGPTGLFVDDSNGDLYFWYNNVQLTGPMFYPGSTVLDGSWHYIAGVFDHHSPGTSTLTLYLDGVAIGFPMTVGNASQPALYPWVIGEDPGNTGFPWSGLIDEVAIYSGALTSTQVATHFAAGGGSISVTVPPISETTLIAPSIIPPVVVPPISSTSMPLVAAGVPTLPSEAGANATNPTYSIVVVTMLGEVVTTLTNAELDDVTWTLNAPDEATFHFPKGKYGTGSIDIFNEVQIYRNGNLLTWGPVIGVDTAGSSGTVTMHLAGVDWYLNRRFLDGVIPNGIDNADFESGTGSWTADGGITFTVDTATFETGAQAAKLVGTTTGADAFITQSAVMGPNGIGLEVIASAWLYIDAFTGAALETRGLYIEGIKDGVFQLNNYYPIDNATPRGKWIKLGTQFWIPPNETWTVNYRLYGINGTLRWDDCKLVVMDSVDASIHDPTTLIQTAADISHIVREIVVHVQRTDVGKSNVYIGLNSETTGTKLIKVYQWVDHVQFDQAMQELLDRGDGADYSIDLTPTTRTFHSYANKRGTDRSGAVTLKYVAGDATSNCVDYRITRDGGKCVTRQTMLGSDNGPDREQAESVDTSHVSNGLILQDVRQAPQETTVDSLQPMADDRISRLAQKPDTIDFDLTGSSGLVGTLMPGDLVTISLTDGFAVVSGTRRVQAVKLNATKNILTVTTAQDTL